MTDTTHTVLIVDDNPSASYMKNRLLSRQGYRVLEAANGKEALTLAAAARPDLVLLDINLPDLSGFEVCRQLKSRTETRFIKVLHTSAARIGARERVKGLEAGADAYLIEPAEEEELLGTVGALLKLADQERDNRRLIERLMNMERQLREATEAADCGMWDWDIVTGKLQWFGAHERLAGMRPGSFSGKVEAFTDILHPEDRPRVWRRLEDLMARGEMQYADEYRFIHADGSVHYMQATGRFYYDEEGRAVRMTGLVQDITERKKGEAALRRNEERLSLLADTAELLLRSESPQMVVEDLCRKAMGLLGCDTFFNFLFDPSARRLRLNACSGIPDEEARRIEWLDLGVAVCGCVARDKLRIVAEHIGETPDGRTELVRSYGIQAYACHPLLAQDRLIGTLSFGSRTKTSFSKEDLSLMKAIADQVAVAMQRKQGEDTLRLSEERLRLAAEAAGFGAYDFDPVRKVSEWSPSLRAMFGLPSDGPVALEEAIGFIHPEDRPRMTEEFQAAIEGRYPDGWELEFRVIRADGQVRWFVDSGRPFFDERDGVRHVSRIVGVVQDLTERKQAEDRLIQNQQTFIELVERAPFGIYIVDSQFRIAHMNAGSQTGAFRNVRPVIGRDVAEAMRILWPEPVAAGIIAVFRRTLVTGEPYYSPRFTNPRHDVNAVESYEWELHRITLPDGQYGVVCYYFDSTKLREAEQAIRHRSQQFETLLNQAPLGVYVVDADFYIAHANPVVRAAWDLADGGIGRHFEEICRMIWGDRLTADIVRVFRHTLETGESFAVPELAEIRADRQVVEYYEWRVDRITLPDGRYGLVCYFRDISAQVQARKAVHDTEERLRLAVESGEIGTWDLNLLTGENRWDARCKVLFGFPADAEVSYEMFLVMLHPDDRLPVEQAIARAVDPSSDGSYDMEYRIVPADGRERWIKAMGRVLFEERGGVRRPMRFTGTALDVTERRKAEAVLREWENRLRLALEAGRMGAWDVDLRTNATQWDEREFALLGLAPGAVEPSPEEFYRRVHPDDLPEVKRLVEASFITRKLTGEFRVIHPDGGVRWLAMEGQILRDELGRPVRMVGINYDVTERKLTEERLRSFAQELETRVQERTQELVQSQERLRALATELNLAELRERKRIATELHDHLQQMLVLGKLKLGQGKRLALPLPPCVDLMKQVDDVLTEALTYTRTLVAELSPPVLRDHGLPAGLKWLGESMKKHDLAVTVSVAADDGPRLPEDQMVLLFQSVRELLINSWKHAGTGEARVAMEHGDGLLRIEVHDDGTGFDLGAAVAAAGDAGPGGGISSKFGLFTIRERMKAMGGSFDLQSQPGKGTTARLVLPLSRRDVRDVRDKRDEQTSPSKPVSPLSPVSRVSPHATIRVLLVDDHLMVRQGLRAVLDGYADVELVGEAADGEQAVALADQLQPAVVVMDINMPKMNGIEATASIKAKHPHVHVIGLSVNAGGENQTRMLQAGARLLLTKEAAVEELYGAIHRVMSRP